MSEKYVGEIFLFGGNFAIRETAYCNGALIPISQNSSLYSIIGATYGGDGRSTFALPDLQGRAAIGFGQGAGLSRISIGQETGVENVVLTQNNLPTHTHLASTNDGQTVTGTVSGLEGTIDNPTGPFTQTSGQFQQTGYSPAQQSVTLQASRNQGNTATPTSNSHLAQSYVPAVGSTANAYLDSAPADSLVDIQGGAVETSGSAEVQGNVTVTGTATIPDGVTVNGGDCNITMPSLPVTVQKSGDSRSFNVRNPSLGMNYLIVMYGLYPSRN